MILGNRQFNRSPVHNQSFIWIADYYDNTYLSEFSFDTHKSNSFMIYNEKTYSIWLDWIGFSSLL